MIQHIDSVGLGSIDWRKGTDKTYNAILTFDSGAPITLTGHTMTAEVYTEANKGGTQVSLSASIADAVGGNVTFTIADDEATISDSLVGTSLYVYMKIVESGGTVRIADNVLTLRVK